MPFSETEKINNNVTILREEFHGEYYGFVIDYKKKLYKVLAHGIEIFNFNLDEEITERDIQSCHEEQRILKRMLMQSAHELKYEQILKTRTFLENICKQYEKLNLKHNELISNNKHAFYLWQSAVSAELQS